MSTTLLEHYAPQAHEIAREPGGGYALLSLLSISGWNVYEVKAFAGDGLIISAVHPIWGTVERNAESAAEVAADLVEECLTRCCNEPLQ